MYDLLALAYRADITRVFTFMMGREVSNRTYTQVGVTEGHHAVSHHQNKPEKLEMLARIQPAQLCGTGDPAASPTGLSRPRAFSR